MSHKHSDLPAIIGLLIGCIVFGMGSIIVAFLPINSYAIAFWRIFIGFLVFAGLTLICKEKYPTHPRAIFFALLGGAFFTFDLSLWHESIHAIGPGISTLLNSLQIFFLSAIGYILYRERLNALQSLSLIIAIVGVALIASPEFSHNQHATWGFISGIISGSCLACSMTSVRKVHDHQTTALIPLMMLFNLGGALIALPFGLLAEGQFLPSTTIDWLWVLIYGLVMQCGAWALVIYAIPKLSLAVTGLLLLSEPVAAILIDATLLHKPISHLQWFGCLITLIAIYLGTLKRQTP